MKFQTLSVITLSLLAATAAHAGQCIFGDDTAALSDMIEHQAFDQGFTKHPAKQKTSDLERSMIVSAVESGDFYKKPYNESDAWQAFNDLDECNNNKPGYDAGIIDYFSNESAEYARVVYYPGENEYGVIVKIRKNRSGEKTIKVVADVRDGSIENCKETL